MFTGATHPSLNDMRGGSALNAILTPPPAVMGEKHGESVAAVSTAAPNKEERRAILMGSLWQL